jgi:O-antigen ligase
LLFVLPFFVFVLLTRAKVLKLVAAALLLYGLYLVANTGSRGALISFSVVALFLISRASGPVRIACLVGIPLLVLAIAAMLPQSIKSRYMTLFNDDSAGERTEATDSYKTRQYLLTTSLQLTLANPLLGVGPGEFSNTEGREARAQGQHGAWQVNHNSYTQVSSEEGVPGLLFYLGALVSTFRLLSSVWKKCRDIPRFRAAAMAAFCLMLAMVGFGVAVFFLSLAYSFYFLFATGLAIALSAAVQREMTLVNQPANARLQRVPAVPVLPRA